MVMLRDNFLVNSITTKNLYHQYIDELWDAGLRYMTFKKPQLGEDASIAQKALFSIWAREIAGYVLKIRPDQVHEATVEEMKRTLKEKFYQATAQEFMITRGPNPYNVDEVITMYTSSATWKWGEAKMVLDHVQIYAAEIGLVLESKGEHKKFTRRETQ
jgi:hypothetical protein